MFIISPFSFLSTILEKKISFFLTDLYQQIYIVLLLACKLGICHLYQHYLFHMVHQFYNLPNLFHHFSRTIHEDLVLFLWRSLVYNLFFLLLLLFLFLLIIKRRQFLDRRHFRLRLSKSFLDDTLQRLQKHKQKAKHHIYVLLFLCNGHHFFFCFFNCICSFTCDNIEGCFSNRRQNII